MDILKVIKGRTKIDVDYLILRLEKELNIVEDNRELIINSLYDTMIIILDRTHQPKVPSGLFTTWLRMTKDYWYLNGFNKLAKNKNENNPEEEKEELNSVTIEEIKIGDTTTKFADETNTVEINGVKYKTGTVEYSEDVLVEKYKKDLYRHRKMRW